jgi:hypothetical protein
MRLRSRYPRLAISPLCGTIVLSAVLSTGMAYAQFNQYTPPGGPSQRPETREEQLKREILGARYHLGPVRIAPELGLKDLAYVRNLLGPEDGTIADATATVSAGLNAFLHTGPKITWVARVKPDYVWWRRRSEARRLNLTSGIEALGFFNRLFVGVAVKRSEQQRILTPEVPEPASGRSDEIEANTEVRLTGALYGFADVREGKEKALIDRTDDPLLQQIALLDRTERVARAGLRWRPRTGWTFGLGGERSEVDFERHAADSSNSGSAPVAELLIDRRRFFFQTDLAARSLHARAGSRFVSFDGITGNAALSVEVAPGLSTWVYGSRNLVYSLSPLYPYLDDRRAGLAMSASLGKRLAPRIFVESGEDRFVRSSPAAPQRTDDLSSFGGALLFRATETLMITLQVTRSRFDSNIPGSDRSYTSGGVTVALGTP